METENHSPTMNMQEPKLSGASFAEGSSKSDDEGGIEFRCPQCDKLYRTPHLHANASFCCKQCEAIFRVELEDEKIQTKATKLPPLQNLMKQGKECPQCGGLNAPTLKECLHCGVVFAKVQGLTSEAKKDGARPSLIRAWQELVKDYNNLQKHLEFMDRCEDLHALPYALKKYQSLKEAQPQDETAQKMFQAAFLRSLKKQPQIAKVQLVVQELLGKVHWARILRISPLVFSAGFVLTGFLSASSRNFIGFGATLLFLVFGFQYLLKGRISMRDFWGSPKN